MPAGEAMRRTKVLSRISEVDSPRSCRVNRVCQRSRRVRISRSRSSTGTSTGEPDTITLSYATAGLAAGEYAAYLPGASGRPQLMRANDGIHMTMAGYRRIGAPVAERLKRDAGLDAAAARLQTTG